MERWKVRLSGRRSEIAMMVGLLVFLVACGGSSSGNAAELPVIDSARTLAEREIDSDAMDEYGFESGSWASAVYASFESLDDVIEYYENGITSDAWDVHASTPMNLGDAHTIMASKDETVATLTIVPRETAAAVPLGGLDAFDVDLSTVAEHAVLVIVTTFTCEEGDVEQCLAL